MSRVRTFAILAVLLVSGCIIGDVTGPLDTPVEFNRIESGNYSDLSYPKGDYVFLNQVDFEVFYNDLICSISVPCTVPTIDFSTNMVLAVVMGQKNTGGYSISIKEVLQRDTGLVAVVQTSSPAGGGVTLALTNPYDIVSVGRVDTNVSFYYK